MRSLRPLLGLKQYWQGCYRNGGGGAMTNTIFIFDLSRCHEDAVLHLNSSPGAIVRPIQFAILTQLRQDLRGFHRVSPHIVTMTRERAKAVL